jgi:nucleoside-diphosphate-sugar epimerase
MRIAVVGGTGFVGSAVVRACEAADHDVRSFRSPRLAATVGTGQEALEHAEAWRRQHTPAFKKLARALEGHDRLVNCAGLALPDAPASPQLSGANALQPVVLALAAQDAGIPAYVHVSSAAVQGRRPVVDESENYDLRSPYAVSKALGEQALAQMSLDTAVRVYRATSVQGPTRAITRSLIAYAQLPIVPCPGDGDQPLPLSLMENAAAAIRTLAAADVADGIFVHPWEGMTLRRFVDLVNPAARVLRLPRSLLALGVEAGFRVGTRVSRAAALAKRADLLVNGQRSSRSSLERLGFVPPLGDSG